MEIVGIEVNGDSIPFFEKNISSGYYRAFMNYCIDNYRLNIIMNQELNQWFSVIPNDPIFKSAFSKGCIQGHNFMYYSLNNSTPEKIGIMYHLANKLGIGLFVYTM